MALLGKAALAMWWDMAPAARADFEHWHAHEHFSERLGIPGFQRASRWRAADGGEGVFVLYELEDHGVLSSPDPRSCHIRDPPPLSSPFRSWSSSTSGRLGRGEHVRRLRVNS